MQQSEEEDTGHSSIVETEAGHQRRVGNPKAVLPTPPVKPTKPAAAGSRRLAELPLEPRQLQQV